MTDTLKFECPGLIQKDLIFNEVDMKPMECFNLKNFSAMYLPQLETLTTYHADSNEELFPFKSLARAVAENLPRGDSQSIGHHLMI